jgi:hypothetical protein
MYAKDHLPPHLHAKYSEFNAYFSIETANIVEGNMPRRAVRLIQDWIGLN